MGSEDRVDCGGQCCPALVFRRRPIFDQVMRFPSGLTVPRRPANWESCQRSTGIKVVAKSLIRDKYLMFFQDPFKLAVVSEIADIGIVS